MQVTAWLCIIMFHNLNKFQPRLGIQVNNNYDTKTKMPKPKLQKGQRKKINNLVKD